MEALTSKMIELNQKLRIYSVFFHYYSNHLLESDALPFVFDELKDCSCENIGSSYEGLKFLTGANKQDLQFARYDFNRLFVGPGTLLAPPYESVYSTKDRVLMQQDTVIVRNFYREAGLEVYDLGSEPDDHIVFELEFICYLLHQVLTGTTKETKHKYLELYKLFVKSRFIPWVGEHCNDVITNAQSDICVGFAKLLQGFIHIENLFIDRNGGNVDELK